MRPQATMTEYGSTRRKYEAFPVEKSTAQMETTRPLEARRFPCYKVLDIKPELPTFLCAAAGTA